MAKCEFDFDDTISCGKHALIRYDGINLCAEHADQNVLALVRQINYLIDNNGAPTRDGDTGKLLAALEPRRE